MSENAIDSENISKAPDTANPRASARNPTARAEGGPGQEGDQQAKGGPHQQESRSDRPYRTPVRRLGVLAERSSFAVISSVALEKVFLPYNQIDEHERKRSEVSNCEHAGTRCHGACLSRRRSLAEPSGGHQN